MTIESAFNGGILFKGYNGFTSSTKGDGVARLKILDGGDVHLFEDTGTTAKMVWSSNKEQLQITSANTGASGWTENVYLKASQYPSLRFWETTGGKVASIGNNGDGSMVISVNGTTGSVGTNAITVDSAGNVGIGTASPLNPLDVVETDTTAESGNVASFRTSSGGYFYVQASDKSVSNPTWTIGTATNEPLAFSSSNAERMRLDSSGNLLVGKTSTTFGTEGFVYERGAAVEVTTDANRVMRLNRTSSDGNILELNKDGTTVGSIGTASSGDLYIADGRNAGVRFDGGNNQIAPCTSSGSNLDATLDLGVSGARFKDLYLSGGVYLGGTGAANKLDDYETGSWTPEISPSVNPFTGLTYGAQVGKYTKVGDRVTVDFNIVINGLTATGTGFVRIIGLPFPSAEGYSKGSIATFNTTIDGDVVNVVLTNRANASSELTVLCNRSGTSSRTLDAEDISSASVLIGSLTYKTNA